ncbi:hypothetical protein [Pseudolysinimonas sp.]|uniref:hypothetical protein n=1 Tax=Pseudolysinimonas sp. TaxID=2680009 RepID=UPI003F7F716B
MTDTEDGPKDDTIEPSAHYQRMRQAYWSAADAFRETAIAEVCALMPEGVHAVLLELNETPRLAVTDLVDSDFNSLMEKWDPSPELDAIDHVFFEMELHTWDDADNLLRRHGVNGFIVEHGEDC